MLTLMLPAIESDDLSAVEVQLEHSLASLSKWEAKHKKAFFSKDDKDESEFRDYLQMMVIGDPPQNFDKRLVPDHFVEAQTYINDPHTATTFREDPNAPQSREIITAEVIYHWMITFKIPFEPCSHWHLNQLMTLIRVCGVKNSKPTKMTKAQQMAEYKRLNDLRRQQLGTSG